MFKSFLNNSATVLPYLSLLILLILTSLLAIKLFKNIFAFLASIGFAFLPFISGVSIQASLIFSPLIVVQVSPSLQSLIIVLGK